MSRILVVEDDPAILRGLRDNPIGEAYEVLTAVDGTSGYDLIRDRRPDLVVLDLMLPDLSGLDLCRRVRGEGMTMPIIMLTAHGEERDRVEGLDVGADDYVTKPFSLSELLARIRSILRHRRDWRHEQDQIDDDVRRAAEVQQRLLPQSRPSVPSLDYAAFCHPARGIGGDYYDYIDLAPGVLGIVVADVSGKGITAALTVAALHALIRSEAPRHGRACDELVGKVNRSLYDIIDGARYATAFYGVYDAASRTLTYVNAGHPASLVIRRDSPDVDPSDVARLESSCPPVGMFSDITPVSATIDLAVGDWLVIYSDGMTEAMSQSGEEFGEDRLIDVVRRNRALGADAMRDAVRGDVSRHAAGRPPSDDLTLVVARVAS